MRWSSTVNAVSPICLYVVCCCFHALCPRSYCLMSCGGRIIIVEVNMFENGSLRSTDGVYDD